MNEYELFLSKVPTVTLLDDSFQNNTIYEYMPISEREWIFNVY